MDDDELEKNMERSDHSSIEVLGWKLKGGIESIAGLSRFEQSAPRIRSRTLLLHHIDRI
jgi:hypothetical protein